MCFGLLGLLFGRSFYRRIERKRDYFTAARDFCVRFSNDLGFSRNKISDIIDNFDNDKAAKFKADLSAYLSSAKFKNSFLSRSEKATITDFFSSLGNTDVDTQLSILKGFDAVFHDLALKYDEKIKKDGTLAVKLGFWGGICMGVLAI